MGFNVGQKLAERYARDRCARLPAATLRGALLCQRALLCSWRTTTEGQTVQGRRAAAAPLPAASIAHAHARAAWPRLSRLRTRAGRPIFADDLQAITFLCKDFWTEVYGKQMDKLRTNHKGVFELQDHRFRAVLRVSAAPEANAGEAARRFLVLPCGMIRGALHALGIHATVRAEAQGLPGVVFVIHVRQHLWGGGAEPPQAPP